MSTVHELPEVRLFAITEERTTLFGQVERDVFLVAWQQNLDEYTCITDQAKSDAHTKALKRYVYVTMTMPPPAQPIRPESDEDGLTQQLVYW